MRCLIGSTLAPFKMERRGDWQRWLTHARACQELCALAGIEVTWFAALQVDARGLGVYSKLIDALEQLRSAWWLFSFDPGGRSWTTSNRLTAICMGRNLITSYALDGFDWIYYADSDIEFPADTIPKLYELDWPVCGGHIPAYCLSGAKALGWPGDCRWHMNSAGSLLVRRDIFTQCPWRIDPDAGQTDDFATQTLYERLQAPTLVRHDVICAHEPLTALENRGHQLKIYR